MLKHIPSLQRLIRQLQHVPYLASKNLYRVAAHFLTSDKKQVEQLCQAILDARERVRPCALCCSWTEDGEFCPICLSKNRDRSSICVVETWHDLMAIEKSDDYSGVYHVLGGSLSPLEGIGPDNLTIDALLDRIDETVKEVIFATNPTPEGEATASFIASKLEGKGLIISRLASGIPIGSSLEYMDRVTIHKAMSGRQPF
jgi:recombination protein RecR